MTITSLIIILIAIFVPAGLIFFFLSKQKKALSLSNQELLTQNQQLNLELKLKQQSYELISEQLSQQKENQTELFNQSQMRFENLAQKIFEEKSKTFSTQNTEQLTLLLNPFKEKLKDFEKKVEETYSSERSERGVLRGEISKLIELNHSMSKETENLTRALKGDNKFQGTWGEMILENILERSGLRKDSEYVIQSIDMNLKNARGEIIRPDVIVKLPDDKNLIVDSKMVLNSFEAYTSATSPEEKEQHGKAFCESLKRHIDGLADKEYHLADKLITQDFILMFIPLEPAFALAFQLKSEIFNYAWERNIAIVSPTTLLTSLRTVASLWKQDRQQKNALEIAKRGGALYDKFVGFVKDLEVLGDRLESTKKAHTDVMSKLSEGRGSLVSQVENLRTLGAKAEKRLSTQLLENSSEDDSLS